jgi:TRAP transporter TAXI family solute receptor
VAAAILLFLAAGLVTAQEIRFFRIGTGTTGGTYFPIGGLLANAISNPPGSRPCDRGGSCGVPGLIAVAQATSGSVENLKEMRSGALESALTQADIAFWAEQATGLYKDQPPFTELNVIANLYTETVHLVVRADSGIRTAADLRGKVVSVGEEGSGTLVEAREILGAYGLREQDVEARYMKPGPAADRLAEGELDAFFIVGGHPVSAVGDVAARIPIRLVSFDDPTAAKLKEKLPFFTETVIDDGVYEGVPATRTLGVGAQWVVRADVPEELVYGITRALWHPSTRRLLDNGHAKGPAIQLSNAVNGLAVPLHPGAARYYREVGLLNQARAEPERTETELPAQ